MEIFVLKITRRWRYRRRRKEVKKEKLLVKHEYHFNYSKPEKIDFYIARVY
jgi:hypothetical protein